MQITKIQEVNKVSNYNVHRKYCRKCLSPLSADSTSDGFCDRECRKLYGLEQRKLNEEVYRGVLYGE